MSDTKKVVVVGGGPCGRMVVKQLKGKGMNITLVQAAKTAELAWYLCETLTGQKAYEQCSTTDPLPTADKIVYGVAIGVCDGKVAVKTPEGKVDLDFDYLVCATGIIMPSFTPVPGQDPAERRREVEDLAKVLTDPNKHVVVAGGGATGVEIAGDILDGGNKNITLITPGDRLLVDQDEKWSKKALDSLQSRGVKVLFGRRCSSHQDTTVADPDSKLMVTTNGGASIECDVYLPAYARGPRTAWLSRPIGDSKQLPDDLMNDKACVKVDEYLASKVYPKLYVMGECSDLDEPALGPNFDKQAQCIAKNIAREKSSKYGGGMLKKPLVQLIGHKSYGFCVPEALNLPRYVSSCICTACGLPVNLLCPCVWGAIICGPCNPMTCGYCCSDAEGKGVTDTIAGAAKLGLGADFAGFVGLAKVAPQEMQR